MNPLNLDPPGKTLADTAAEQAKTIHQGDPMQSSDPITGGALNLPPNRDLVIKSLAQAKKLRGVRDVHQAAAFLNHDKAAHAAKKAKAKATHKMKVKARRAKGKG